MKMNHRKWSHCAVLMWLGTVLPMCVWAQGDGAGALDALAATYEATGSYALAEPLRKQALEIREKALGPEHPVTATSLNNLAMLYYATGAYAQAEPLLKRALEIREKALGPEHPKIA